MALLSCGACSRLGGPAPASRIAAVSSCRSRAASVYLGFFSPPSFCSLDDPRGRRLHAHDRANGGGVSRLATPRVSPLLGSPSSLRLRFSMTAPRAQTEPEDAIREMAKSIMDKEEQKQEPKEKHKEPEWVDVILEEARKDEDLAETIKGCVTAQEIEERVRERFNTRSEEIYSEIRTRASQEELAVEIRSYDPQDMWLQVNLSSAPERNERLLVEEVFRSWYVLGHLGAFNNMNLQLSEGWYLELRSFANGAGGEGEGEEGDDDDLEDDPEVYSMTYSSEKARKALPASFHNMGEVEIKGSKIRCWFDLGTADAVALDALVNSFRTLSREYFEIDKLIIGALRKDWVD